MRETYAAFGLHVPEDTLAALNRYIAEGMPTGGFLEAVITNDLHGSIARADPGNMTALPAIVSYLYNEAPAPCWGSPEKVAAWIESHRANRERQATA